MPQFLRRLWREEKGEGLPEYALLLILICLTAVSTVSSMAAKVTNIYSNASTQVSVPTPSPSLRGSYAVFSTDSPTNAGPGSEVSMKPDRPQ